MERRSLDDRSFIDDLVNARYKKIFDEEEYRKFNFFLIRIAIPSGGYAISIPRLGEERFLIIHRIKVDNGNWLEVEKGLIVTADEKENPRSSNSYPVYMLEEDQKNEYL